jgi:bifunctional DNA-binding transcriptional regulator/antitoxin component of YhaV-PrlF toxin-antitoxin module
MGRKAETYIRKVTRASKRSLYINIPADIVRELKLRERQRLVIKRVGEKIVIEDWSPEKHK